MASMNRHLLSAAVLAHAFAWWLGVQPVALDPDAMNLVYGMHQFDIAHFNPHPPGYLVYIWTLRAVHALAGGGDALIERFATVQRVSLLFGLASIGVTYAAARRMKLGGAVAGWAALVMAVHPILVFHSVDAQTHTSEALASGLLMWGLLSYRESPGWRRALGVGLVLAFGSALRPSFVIFAIPVIVWTIGPRRLADLMVAGVASIVCASAWIVPTVLASGGWETWRAATGGWLHQGFVLTSSPFSDSAVRSLVWANELSLGLWAFEALLPLLVALAVSGSARPGDVSLAAAANARWLRGTLLIGGGLCVAYYAATFVSEPGYLASLLPPVALGVASVTARSKGARPAAWAVVCTLACWAIPPIPHVLKVPSVTEWHRRTELPLAYAEHVERVLPGPGRYLAVIGHPDITLGRQLPMLAPRVDALLVHDGRWPWFRRTSLTYVTELDSVPIPEAFETRGAGSSEATLQSYVGIYFDGTLPTHFQSQIALQSSCPVGRATDVTQTVIVPVRCLQSGRLSLDALDLRIGGNDPRASAPSGQL